MQHNGRDLHRLTRLSLLTAAALILFVIELRLPDIAIPGVKLGLANIITVYAVFSCTAGETCLLVAVRLLLGAMFAGNVSTLLYSAAGAALCLLGMLFVRHFVPETYIWLCSIFGAMLHNTGQMAAAVLLMRTSAVLSYLPLLLIAGSIAGLLTGLCAQAIVKRFPKKL